MMHACACNICNNTKRDNSLENNEQSLNFWCITFYVGSITKCKYTYV